MGNYITISAACNSYDVTRKTIYNWRDKGLIKEKKDGRSVLLDVESIEKLITQKQPQNITQQNPDLQQEIQKLQERIDHLEKIVTQLLPDPTGKRTQPLPNSTGNNTQPLPKQSEYGTTDKAQAYNDERKQGVLSKLVEAIQANPNETMKTKIADIAGIDRRTVSKYWDEAQQLAQSGE